jgi:curved DNA-binding protein CbpA
MTDINPYQILGIPTDATLETVKDVYRQLATKHHPDKGGNPETFKIIKLAFKMIADNIKKGVQIPRSTANTFTELKESAQALPPVKYQSPQEFFGKDHQIDPNHEFNVQSFNQKFMQNVKEDDNCLGGATAGDYREKRTKEQLLLEQQTINDEMSSIRPIFNGKDFNPNVFNRLFEQINGSPQEKKELQAYEEPSALTSGLQPYTEIDDNQKCKQTNGLSSLGYSDISEGFGQKNPNQINQDMINQLAKQPDITDVNTLESDYHSKIKQRLNEYQNVQLNFHPKPADPSQLPEQIRATNSSVDKMSQQSLNDAYNRKMQERNSLYAPSMQQPSMQQPSMQPAFRQPQQFPQQHHALPVMDYPQSSNMEKFGTPLTQTQPSQPQQSQQPDYFVKIPSAQMHAYNQQGNFYQTTQQPQMMPMGQMNLLNPLGQMNINGQKSLPNFQQPQQVQMQPQPQQANIDQIQQQLQALQKTVLQQKKIIRTLKKK